MIQFKQSQHFNKIIDTYQILLTYCLLDIDWIKNSLLMEKKRVFIDMFDR